MNGDILKIFACPACKEAVTGFESECPRCKKPFDASVKFECPVCGGAVIAGSKSCPSCNVEFEDLSTTPASEAEDKSVEALLDELQDIKNGDVEPEPERPPVVPRKPQDIAEES